MLALSVHDLAALLSAVLAGVAVAGLMPASSRRVRRLRSEHVERRPPGWVLAPVRYSPFSPGQRYWLAAIHGRKANIWSKLISRCMTLPRCSPRWLSSHCGVCTSSPTMVSRVPGA